MKSINNDSKLRLSEISPVIAEFIKVYEIDDIAFCLIFLANNEIFLK